LPTIKVIKSLLKTNREKLLIDENKLNILTQNLKCLKENWRVRSEKLITFFLYRKLLEKFDDFTCANLLAVKIFSSIYNFPLTLRHIEEIHIM